MATNDWKELRGKLASASRILYREGVVEGFGHVSARIPGTDTFLIPRRMSPAAYSDKERSDQPSALSRNAHASSLNPNC